MEFKKCNRCGNFFVSDKDTCYNCSTKDELEITKLKNYFEINSNADSLEEISNNTGITIKNLDRYMNKDEFKKISKNITHLKEFDNLSTNL